MEDFSIKRNICLFLFEMIDTSFVCVWIIELCSVDEWPSLAYLVEMSSSGEW